MPKIQSLFLFLALGASLEARADVAVDSIRLAMKAGVISPTLVASNLTQYDTLLGNVRMLAAAAPADARSANALHATLEDLQARVEKQTAAVNAFRSLPGGERLLGAIVPDAVATIDGIRGEIVAAKEAERDRRYAAVRAQAGKSIARLRTARRELLQ